ncbi:hypothetical protein PUNSTDRAFT_131271 [Punctularia strigosozonata HHB-11173 SS5]|uniref:uncharacterized protein n=1 Tax=Punctularia strigosozonata (strain HHB-11173) TaxID=741275 RepID=UPI0004417D59|nr:uncharacterized protein PUNSTDRAFT_131271 [Punctularia strigosozonata HHB-11173 SS5]EIN13049.1 hypothetical protein PUNSTDRAFT_131271 [Punctularia strigosozonata HHB-11173 SS5]
MHFSRIIATFFVVVTFGAFVLSSPAVDKGSDTSEIETTLKNLKNNIAPTLSAIKATHAHDIASAATVGPLIADLVSEIEKATSSLGTVTEERSQVAAKRQISDAELAALVSDIIKASPNTGFISNLFAQAGLGSCGCIGGYCISARNRCGLDTSLAEFLAGLETVVAGVVALAATILTVASDIFTDLSLDLTAAALGL